MFSHVLTGFEHSIIETSIQPNKPYFQSVQTLKKLRGFVAKYFEHSVLRQTGEDYMKQKRNEVKVGRE